MDYRLVYEKYFDKKKIWGDFFEILYKVRNGDFSPYLFLKT